MVVPERPAAERLRLSGDRFVSPVLVGREAETQLVLGALEAPPRFVFICGDAGMGKTRLCKWILENPAFRGHRLLHGQCQPLREPFPLGALVEALRGAARFVQKGKLGSVAGALVPMIPELADRLPPPLEPLGDPPSERHRLFRALAEVLGSMGAATLIIEDLHWSDDATADFLMFLSGQMPADLTILATLREDEIPREGSLRRLIEQRTPLSIALEPLSQDEVRAMVAAILDTDVSQEFATFLHERSGGVPFAVEELVRLLKDREDLIQQSGRWIRRELEAIEVPAGLKEPVLERLRRLTPAGQRLVETAAVVGQPVAGAFVVTIAPNEAGPDALTEALASRVLVERDGLVGFRHALAKQAVEETIPGQLRRRLHLRAGRELQRSDPKAFGRLVRHFREACQWPEFVRYSEAAADAASKHNDDASAAYFLTEAIGIAPIAPADRVRMSLKLGEAALHGLQHDPAIAILERVVDDESIPATDRAELRMSLASLQVQAGDALGFDNLLEAAGELGGRPEVLVEAYCQLAWPLAPRGTLEQHVEWMDQASALARDLVDPVVDMKIRHDEAFLLLYSGDRRGLRAALDISVNLSSRELQREWLRGRNNLGYALLLLGHYEQALQLFHEGMRISLQCGYERWIASLQTGECVAHFSNGSWRGLVTRLNSLIESARNHPNTSVDVELCLAQLLLSKGRISAAEELLRGVSVRSRQMSMVPVYAAAQGSLARLELSRGATKRAIQLVRPAVSEIRRKGIWVWATPVLEPAVQALLQDDRRDEAELLVTEVRAGIRGREAPLAEAALSASLGHLAGDGEDVVEALRHFRRSFKIYSALPNPLEANRQRAQIGRLLAASDQRRGRDLLERAVRELDRLGAAWDAARVRQILHRMGVTVPYRGGRRGYGAQLSPRELEVARLAVELSNRQVAERLFLSVKTVERHVSSAMRKVQVTRRAELAAHLGQADPQVIS